MPDMSAITPVLLLVIAALTLWNTFQRQREERLNKSLEAIETRLKAEREVIRADMNNRISQAQAKALEAEAKVSELRLAFTEYQARVPSRQDLDKALETVMGPVIEHMQRTEAFIEEVLRAGVLLKDRR